ncbi:MFS general substrate transporter [Dothidotthia symphoricarpi CBS 119687]|uniref:MFS general substrate transporter n=1 Tax=Dothidotthia symphoricarpi CBS 119687 TaxID=1392245 RepID=A0A6A5ZZ41_9PLEO|nr:MFS general substrate transporter [Dothidotthia symphoricarpi CBS 119687]KAF2124556.1 MFS general substrate transporter [Dothidotthia symphoricarpi CBS 119687]
MSLAERITTLEEYQPWSREASPSSRDRKLSFNPVGTWTEATGELPTVGAFEVPKWKRLLQVFLAVIYCLFAAGVVFGYAAIKPVLLEEGVYRDRCTKDELEQGVSVCYEQELRLNLMFTIAAVSTNVVALPVGTVLDRFGPRVCGIIGALCITAGSLLFAFAAELPFDAYIPGYLFMALGGPFIFISSFQLSNTFPQYSGLILALLTGAFDTSSAVFLIYRLIYQATDNSFTVKSFFLIYLVVPAYIFIVQLFFMPATSYKTVGELVIQAEEETAILHDEDDDTQDPSTIHARRAHRDSIVSEITSLLGTHDGAQQAQDEEKKRNVSGVWGALHGRTAAQQIRTPWFILITLFTVLQMTRINYFVATIRSQYIYLFHSHAKAVEINNFFDVALPVGGVISVPFIGLLLDNTSTTFTLSLLVTVATTIGVLGVIPEAWAAYANICLFVLYRPLYYTAVSDYSAKVFGFATFGKVYGLIICLAGLLNFSQSALDAATHKIFHNDPVPVNLVLLGAALLVGAALVLFVWRRSGKILREAVEEEAQGAREVLMPGVEYGTVNGNGLGSGSGEESRGRRM